MEGELTSGDPMSKLTDDILVDIISRVPYKSTCGCRCVSTRWRDLFSHPDHRKKLPQHLAGFFHEGRNKNRYFTNVSGEGEPLIDPSLSFLPKYEDVEVLDCCNGLLLCRCWKARKTLDYVVCNPATEKWVVVPATDWSSKVNVARLGFDPAVSSHFHVFEFIDEKAWGIAESELNDEVEDRIETLAIYSSKAGAWTHQTLEFEFAIPTHSRGVFLNGVLHLATSYKYFASVNVEGSDWRFIDHRVPRFSDDAHSDAMFVSQGHLYLTNIYAGSDGSQLSVWALEDYLIEEFTLKHNVSHLELFGAWRSSFANRYDVVSFHPERNMIFIVCGHENRLMSYDMDCRKLCFISQLGQDCEIQQGRTPYLPYVPLFLEALADGQ